ncbi:Aldo/keto reductase [Mycena alexandri]|uniref:Aldo/keto reductase n=1 Tax=Mycena alexandri TaxID=1745969 RepID=A0AAD6SJN0_9AGAR|nr:Aldo/keto reductase [Mycena alexandri]
MANVPFFTLNDGTKIPCLGMGCWMGGPGGGERVYEMCAEALKCGYRHFDTAAGYGNEEEVGRAIRDSGIPRSEIYVTTKLGSPDHHRVKDAFEESLKKLDVSYIDLYLMHWPQGTIYPRSSVYREPTPFRSFMGPEEHPMYIETWKEMEKLMQTGRVKTLGVSNFSIKTLEHLLPHCEIIPATNQVELHPCLPQTELKAYCEAKKIFLTAYSPLGRSTFLIEDATIKTLAQKVNTSPAQILISWAIQRGIITVPKSENRERMRANMTLVSLSAEDMAVVDALHQKPNMHKSLLVYHDKEAPGGVFGWTYEQLGWNLVLGGVVPTD